MELVLTSGSLFLVKGSKRVDLLNLRVSVFNASFWILSNPDGSKLMLSRSTTVTKASVDRCAMDRPEVDWSGFYSLTDRGPTSQAEIDRLLSAVEKLRTAEGTEAFEAKVPSTVRASEEVGGEVSREVATESCKQVEKDLRSAAKRRKLDGESNSDISAIRADVGAIRKQLEAILQLLVGLENVGKQ